MHCSIQHLHWLVMVNGITSKVQSFSRKLQLAWHMPADSASLLLSAVDHVHSPGRTLFSAPVHVGMQANALRGIAMCGGSMRMLRCWP